MEDRASGQVEEPTIKGCDAIRWPVLDGLDGMGLLLQPNGPREPVADVIAIPDCEVTPEQLGRVVEGVPSESQYARILAESGCRVVVPLLVNRQRSQFDWGRGQLLPSRIARCSTEVRMSGRGLIAYEVQTVQAVVDWFQAKTKRPTGVIGWGEGGLIVLYTSAIDSRIDATVVSGYFQPRQAIWQEPDRSQRVRVAGTVRRRRIRQPDRAVRADHRSRQRRQEADFPGNGGIRPLSTTPRLDAVRVKVARATDLVKPLALKSVPYADRRSRRSGPCRSTRDTAGVSEKFEAVNGAKGKRCSPIRRICNSTRRITPS